MINNIEGKSAKELREIVLIQQEEYKKLINENAELEAQVKTQQSHIDNALDNSKESLISRIAELEMSLEELKGADYENKALRLFVTDLSSMCIGELAMGYKLDAQAIGESIYSATHMTTPELNKDLEDHNIKQQAKGISDFFKANQPRISMGKKALWEIDSAQVGSYLADNLEQGRKLGND